MNHSKSHHVGQCLLVLCLLVLFPALTQAQQLPEWTQKIRSDHPRLFFNAETWPAVKQRALGAESDWYRQVKARTDRLEIQTRNEATLAPRDLGPDAATAAFIFRVTKENRYLQLAQKCLRASVEHYEACYQQRKTVNWYSTSRVHAVMAWDWLYNDLAAAGASGNHDPPGPNDRPRRKGKAGHLSREPVGLQHRLLRCEKLFVVHRLHRIRHGNRIGNRQLMAGLGT